MKKVEEIKISKFNILKSRKNLKMNKQLRSLTFIFIKNLKDKFSRIKINLILLFITILNRIQQLEEDPMTLTI